MSVYRRQVGLQQIKTFLSISERGRAPIRPEIFKPSNVIKYISCNSLCVNVFILHKMPSFATGSGNLFVRFVFSIQLTDRGGTSSGYLLV